MPDMEKQNRWTPELWIQLFKEVVTAILGLTLVVATVIAAYYTMEYAGDTAKMPDAKDVLLLLLGLAGVVLGYYFGRVPADMRATQAQQQANVASALTAQVTEQAETAADQVDALMTGMPGPTDSSARGTAATPMDEKMKRDMQEIRDSLRNAASMGRRR